MVEIVVGVNIVLLFDVEQKIAAFVVRLQIDDGWLVVFDRRKGISPVSQRLGAVKEKTPAGREVVLVRA